MPQEEADDIGAKVAKHIDAEKEQKEIILTPEQEKIKNEIILGNREIPINLLNFFQKLRDLKKVILKLTKMNLKNTILRKMD